MSNEENEAETEAAPDSAEPEKTALNNSEPEDRSKLPPTKRYLPKPRKIIIPFVIPWESSAAIQTQKGMGAFGASRNAITSVTGSKPLKQGELNTETFLTKFAGGNNFANQAGMHSFGQQRLQTSKFTSSKELDKSRVQASEGIIPRQAGNTEGSNQSGETPIGSIRSQVPKIKFQTGMTERMDPGSDSEVSKFWSPNPNNRAGTGVIDIRRQAILHVQGGSKHDSRTESIIPRLQQRKEIDSAIGSTRSGYFGLGPCRQVVTPVSDTFMSELTEIDKRRSKNMVPWSSRGTLASQAGSGGFQTRRDVVSQATDVVAAGF